MAGPSDATQKPRENLGSLEPSAPPPAKTPADIVSDWWNDTASPWLDDRILSFSRPVVWDTASIRQTLQTKIPGLTSQAIDQIITTLDTQDHKCDQVVVSKNLSEERITRLLIPIWKQCEAQGHPLISAPWVVAKILTKELPQFIDNANTNASAEAKLALAQMAPDLKGSGNLKYFADGKQKMEEAVPMTFATPGVTNAITAEEAKVILGQLIRFALNVYSREPGYERQAYAYERRAFLLHLFRQGYTVANFETLIARSDVQSFLKQARSFLRESHLNIQEAFTKLYRSFESLPNLLTPNEIPLNPSTGRALTTAEVVQSYGFPPTARALELAKVDPNALIKAIDRALASLRDGAKAGVRQGRSFPGPSKILAIGALAAVGAAAGIGAYLWYSTNKRE